MKPGTLIAFRHRGSLIRRRAPGEALTLDYFLENSAPEPNTGCWLWLGSTDTRGYGGVGIDGRKVLLHRLTFELAKGEKVPAHLVVCHRCDTPVCINPDHLFLGTRSDNTQDSMRKGRHHTPRSDSTNHPRAKVTREQVALIRADTRSHPKIAALYGISKSTVYYIKHGLSWRDA